MADAANGGFSEGERVNFCGLVGRADLNGKSGKLVQFDSNTGRWMVRCDRESVNVRPSNLQVAPVTSTAPIKFAGAKAKAKAKAKPKARSAAKVGEGLKTGKRIVFVGLSGRADLNGAVGILGKLDTSAGRWMVTVVKTSEEVNVRPLNLQLSEPTGRTVAGKAQKRPLKRKLIRMARSAENAETDDKPKQMRIPKKKPKRALNAYMLFSRKVRPQIMDEHRSRYGSVDNSMMFSEIAELWADLEDKDRRKYERQAQKLKESRAEKIQAYERNCLEKSDPVGALRKRYEHLIPKRATSAYFLFISDQSQRQKAAADLKSNGEEEKSINAKLAEMWKACPDEEKARYETQYAQDKMEYEKKWKAWQQTKEYAELDALERKQKEALRAKKQAEKAKEDSIMQELVKEGAAPGLGLTPGKSAVITGLTTREDLNGKEVTLVSFDEEGERWKIKLDADYINVRPANLLLLKLLHEVDKAQKKEQGEAVKKQRREAEKNEIQELLNEGAGPGRGLASGRSAVITGLSSREDLNGTEVKLAEFNEESGRWRVIQVDSNEPMNLRPENLYLSLLHAVVSKQEQAEKRKEAQAAAKAAKEAAKLAMKEAAKEVDREFREAARRLAEANKVALQKETATWSADIEFCD